MPRYKAAHAAAVPNQMIHCPGDVKRPIHNRELNSSNVKPNNNAKPNNNVKSNNNDSPQILASCACGLLLYRHILLDLTRFYAEQ